MIGLMCLLKPQFGLFLLWGAIRREWRFSLSLISVCAVGGAISVLAFGLKNHIDYLAVLRYLAQHGELYYHNQSFNGLLNRLFADPTASLTWDGEGFPPVNPLVYYGTLTLSALLMGLALWPRRDARSVLDFQTAALAITLASPIAWEHHFGIMAPMFVALLAGVLCAPQSIARRFAAGVLAIAYMLCANNLLVLERLANTPLHFLLSYTFFGAIATLALLASPLRGTRAMFTPAASAEPERAIGLVPAWMTNARRSEAKQG